MTMHTFETTEAYALCVRHAAETALALHHAGSELLHAVLDAAHMHDAHKEDVLFVAKAILEFENSMVSA